MGQMGLFADEKNNSGSNDCQKTGSASCRGSQASSGTLDYETTAFADYGQRRFTVMVRDAVIEMSADEFISLEWADGVSMIVGEDAHLQSPRTDKSLAQPMTADQIRTLLSNSSKMGIAVKCSHAKMTGRVHRDIDLEYYNDGRKTDKRDVEIFQEYFCSERLSYICLRSLREVSPTNDETIKEMHVIANAVRTSWGGGSPVAYPEFLPGVDHVYKLIDNAGLLAPSPRLLDSIAGTCMSDNIDKSEIKGAIKMMSTLERAW